MENRCVYLVEGKKRPCGTIAVYMYKGSSYCRKHIVIVQQED